jgi:hypothetical protein
VRFKNHLAPSVDRRFRFRHESLCQLTTPYACHRLRLPRCSTASSRVDPSPCSTRSVHGPHTPRCAGSPVRRKIDEGREQEQWQKTRVPAPVTGKGRSALGRLHHGRQEDRPTFLAAKRAAGASARGNLAVHVSQRHATVQCFRNQKAGGGARSMSRPWLEAADGKTMLQDLE